MEYFIGIVAVFVIGYVLYDKFKPASGVRARNDKGHFVADNPETKRVNEAFVDGKTPRKRRAPAKKTTGKKPEVNKAPARRGRPSKSTNKK